MAKFAEGIHHPPGTYGNITIYNMYGRTYMRSKSSLTRKRVLKSKAFAKTRVYAGKFGEAQRIGSVIYRALPANIKERWLYRAIAGEAASLLYEGKDELTVEKFLWKKYITDTNAESDKKMVINGRNMAHSSRETNKELRELFLERWEAKGLSYSNFKHAWQKRGYFSRERFRSTLDFMNRPWRKK